MFKISSRSYRSRIDFDGEKKGLNTARGNSDLDATKRMVIFMESKAKINYSRD